jgi:hypothetical protein
MKILDAGHDYLLDSLDDGIRQRLTFVKREGPGFPFNNGSYPGTNCQEVLRALIERTEYLNRQIACAETEAAIGLLKSALLLFEIRAARRHERHLDLTDLKDLSSFPTCEKCGHIQCEGHTKE